MNETSIKYIQRLKERYKHYEDNDSLLALASLEQQSQRVRELEVYREQEKTQELIAGAISRFRGCVEKLTNPLNKLSDLEREYCFASMDWARFTLDLVGEDPKLLEQEIERTVATYAHRAGLST